METQSSDPQQLIDKEHLKLLSIFHYVVGGLTGLFACFPIFHLGLGLVMVLAPQVFGQGQQQPPPAFGWILVIMASVLILAGWTLAICILIAARSIALRKRYTFCFVIACVECLFMPFGTVLGIFTILALNRQSVKEQFVR